MSRIPRVGRSSEEKWQIVQEGMKSGNVSETCQLAPLLRFILPAIEQISHRDVAMPLPFDQSTIAGA